MKPDFSMPTKEMPTVCSDLDKTNWDKLEQLIGDTEDAMTYTNWLEEQFDGACGSAANMHR